MAELQIVSDAGYQALSALKDRKPELFTNPNPDALKAAMPTVIKEENPQILWDTPVTLQGSLAAINQDPKPGPTEDAQNASILQRALPQLGVQSWNHERLWASINCFALPEWVPVRWSTSRTKSIKEREFVNKHWLKANVAGRESNASMRLFTLSTLSRRAAAFSTRTEQELLDAMASRVNLFHRTLRYPYLIANSKLLAHIWDSALDDPSNTTVFQTKIAST